MLLKSLQRHPILSKNPALKAYLPLDGNALDYKGTNNGTVTGATPVPSNNQYIPASLAYKFNGTSNYINLASGFGSLSDLTISFWFKYSATTRGDILDIFKTDNTEALLLMQNQLSSGVAAGRLSVNLYYSGANHYVDCTKSGLNNNRWYHLVYVLNVASQHIYINGVLSGTATNGSAISFDKPYIGRDGVNLVNYYNGNLKDFFVFSRALSAKEISDYYSWITRAKKSWTYTILSAAYELIMEVGSFTIFGQAVLFQRLLQLVMAAGVYTLVGVSALFQRALKLTMDSGSYVLTGFIASIFKGYEMILSAGSYVLSGNNLSIGRLYSMILSAGSYILTGFNLDTGFFKSFKQSIPKMFGFSKAKPKQL